jgi:hypothetical protein
MEKEKKRLEHCDKVVEKAIDELRYMLHCMSEQRDAWQKESIISKVNHLFEYYNEANYLHFEIWCHNEDMLYSKDKEDL